MTSNSIGKHQQKPAMRSALKPDIVIRAITATLAGDFAAAFAAGLALDLPDYAKPGAIQTANCNELEIANFALDIAS